MAKQKKYSKLLKIWRVEKLTTLNWCKSQVNFDFARFGPLSSYLRLMYSRIGINLAKLNVKEVKDQTDRLVKKKASKPANKKRENIKKMF